MFITIEYLTEAFKKYNSLYFDNELPMPNAFKIGRGVQRLGYFQVRRVRGVVTKLTIAVSQYNGLRTQQDIDTTLIHEMIHLWQHIKGYTDSHGQSFKNKSWDVYLKSKGVFNITRCRNVGLEATATAKDLPQPKSASCICVLVAQDKTDGKYWLIGSAETKVGHWIQYFRRNAHRWIFIHWFETQDKDMMKLTRCVSRLRGRFFNTANDLLLFAREKKLNFLVKSLENQN
jgi:hypothetical protein